MILRRQLPAYSPLPLAAVAAGMVALARRPDASRAAAARLISHELACDEVVLADSGTSALALALRLAHRASGQPVALPAYGCYDLATAAATADVPVLLYDLDPRTLAPDGDSLRQVVRQGAGAAVVVEPFGFPLDLGEVRDALGGALLVEDAAQAAGAWLDGGQAGSAGDLAVLSFSRGKGRTAGAGGALLIRCGDRLAVADAGRGLERGQRGAAEVARLWVQWLLGRPGAYAIPASLPFLHLGETVLRQPAPPRQMSGAAARVLAATWHLTAEETAVRRRNARRLLEVLEEAPALTAIRPASAGVPGFLRLPVLARRPAGAVVDAAALRLGIAPGYPHPLGELPLLAAICANHQHAFPGARLLSAHMLTLPTHSRLREKDLQRLDRWCHSAL